MPLESGLYGDQGGDKLVLAHQRRGLQTPPGAEHGPAPQRVGNSGVLHCRRER